MYATVFQGSFLFKNKFGKSELVPVGDVRNVEALAFILGCNVAQLPMIYLSLPWDRDLNLRKFGPLFLTRWHNVWLVERNFIYPREVNIL